jgi:hypothetical protein
MVSRIIMVALCLLCVATPASAQAERVGLNGEEVTDWAYLDLAAGQLMAGFALYVGEQNKPYPGTWPAVLSAGLTLSAAGTVAYVFSDDLTFGLAQSLNSGMLWTFYYALGVDAMIRPDDGGEEASYLSLRSLVWSLPLGMALGGLYYWGYEPASGQVSALNSVGFLSVWIAGATAGDAPWLSAPLVVGAPFIGALVAHLKPLSRRDVWIADGVAVTSALLWSLAPISNGRRAELTPLIAAAAFTTAYLLLPTYQLNAEDPGTGFALSIVPGDAIAPVAGEQQGGLGLSASWAW